jgi:hypothetical protein
VRRALLIASLLAVVTASAASGRSDDVWTRLHRPLHLPHLERGQACPRTPGLLANQFSPYGTSLAFGRGPVYPLIALTNADGSALVNMRGREDEWGAFKVLWLTAPSYSGPSLIRGRRIDARGLIRFQEDWGKPKELRIWGSGGSNNGWSDRASEELVRKPGCYAFQIDGTTFSRIVVFAAVPE